jgi:urease accessory protein UreH
MRVGAGARLKFHPHLMIMGGDADLVQSVQIELEEGAELDYSEQWCAGRIGMGELWRFLSFDYHLQIKRNGELIYRERWHLKPGEQPLTHPSICGGFTHFRNHFVFASDSEHVEATPAGELEPSMKEDTPSSDDGSAETIKTWTLSREKGRITRSAYRQKTN